MRTFSIRNLLLCVTVLAVLFALDSSATAWKTNFLNSLDTSPTRALRTENNGYAACWQTESRITDSTSLTDRLLLQRRLIVEHTLHVLFDEADGEFEPRTAESEILLSWNGLNMNTGYHVGTTFWLSRESTPIPDDAIRRTTMH